MAYPTEPTETIVTIATNANHSDPGEAWDGQPTKVSPSVGLQATGFTPSTPVPPGAFNYLFNTLAKWATYFKQGFADLQTRISSDEWVYPTGKSRTVRISGVALAGPAGAPAQTARDYVFVATSSSAHAYLDLCAYVPTGATVTKIEARVKPGAARSGTNRVTLAYYSGSGDSGGTFSSSYYDDTTANAQTIGTGTISLAADCAKRQVVDLRAGNTASADNDEFLWVDITFTDPGPRNF